MRGVGRSGAADLWGRRAGELPRGELLEAPRSPGRQLAGCRWDGATRSPATGFGALAERVGTAPWDGAPLCDHPPSRAVVEPGILPAVRRLHAGRRRLRGARVRRAGVTASSSPPAVMRISRRRPLPRSIAVTVASRCPSRTQSKMARSRIRCRTSSEFTGASMSWYQVGHAAVLRSSTVTRKTPIRHAVWPNDRRPQFGGCEFGACAEFASLGGPSGPARERSGAGWACYIPHNS